jgi:hypothetical protein
MNQRHDITYAAEPITSLEHELRPLHDLLHYLREYARDRPEVVALTCFAVGFFLGWRLKPW